MQEIINAFSGLSPQTISIVLGVVFFLILIETVRSVIRSIRRKIVYLVTALLISGGGGGAMAWKSFNQKAEKEVRKVIHERKTNGSN